MCSSDLKMGNMFRGNIDRDDSWSVFDETFECEEVSWMFFYKIHEKGFLNMKIAARGKAKKKANYWFSYKLSDKSTFGRDFTVMKENRPDLLRFVQNGMEKILLNAA